MEAKVYAYVAAFAGDVDESGRRLVVRNGHAVARGIATGAGAVEVLPLMYLHGMSSGDFAPALSELFGSSAGLSASVVTGLTTK